MAIDRMHAGSTQMGMRMNRCMGCMESLHVQEMVCSRCGYKVGTPPREAYHLMPQTILQKRYVVGRVLGFGGFGVTYIGYDQSLERKVAIKEFLPSQFATRMPGAAEVTIYGGEYTLAFSQGLSRFLEEGRRLAQFNTFPGIVHIFDHFEENSTAYLVMELLEGQDIKTILKTNGSLPYETVKEIILSVCQTLELVHARGMIHRDISPDNIYITNTGEIKLIDFGAARFETSKNSRSLSVILKEGYAPQEQYRSRGKQGSFSDIYALAATMYKMLTGVTPQDSMERAVKEELIEPTKMGVFLPSAQENALMNALAIRAEDRTQTAEDFANQLRMDEVERNKIKKSTSDDGSMSKRAKTILGITLGGTLLLGLLTVSGVFGERSLLIDSFGSSLEEGYINTPGVVNLNQQEAKEKVEQAGLVYLVTGKEYSDEIEKDKVLGQSPLPGRSIEVGKQLEVVICGGSMEQAKSQKVLDVTYLNSLVACEQLEQQGWQVEKQFLYSNDIKKGLVMSQGEIKEGIILLTISLGPIVQTDESTQGVPYAQITKKGELLLLECVYPIRTQESLQCEFEYAIQGYENYRVIEPLNQKDYLPKMRFYEGNADEIQKSVLEYSIMDLAGSLSQGKENFHLRTRACSYFLKDTTTEIVEQVTIEKKADQVRVSEIEEVEAESGYGYKLLGDFKAGASYYLYDGLFAGERPRSVRAETDGELLLETATEFDGSRVLVRFYPLLGTQKTQSGYQITVGSSTTVDGSTMIIKGLTEDLREKSVLDAITMLSQKADGYAYKIPYRFSYVFDETVERGCIIDYYMEGDTENGEIYKLDIVVSNGPYIENKGDYLVPVQWIPGESYDDEEPFYATLRYFVMQGILEEDYSTKAIAILVSKEDENWLATASEMDLQYGYHRADGISRENYLEPEGHLSFDAYAKELRRQGKLERSQKLCAKLIPVFQNSDTIIGDTLELNVKTNQELKKLNLN